jgi:hypothetical protein
MNMRQSKALLGRGDTAGDEISDESSLHAQDSKATIHYINGPREDAPIPRPGMALVKGQVAVVITDLQNDFLSPKGGTWGIVGQSVTENNTVEQEMPTQSEENNQVIQHRYYALGRGDTDALFASMHKGDPQERDRRVLQNMIFMASTGLAMILAAIFATVLELPDFWQNLWLAICLSFTLLFFVGVLRFGSALS